MKTVIYLIGSLCVIVSNAFNWVKISQLFSSRRTLVLKLHIKDVESVSQAFVGGTVGVMSVALILELRKISDRNLEGCPYCMGNGEILCGCCLGAGNADNLTSCARCNGRGLIVCINCKGDGRETPIMLLSKAARNPVSSRAKSVVMLCCAVQYLQLYSDENEID